MSITNPAYRRLIRMTGGIDDPDCADPWGELIGCTITAGGTVLDDVHAPLGEDVWYFSLLSDGGNQESIAEAWANFVKFMQNTHGMSIVSGSSKIQTVTDDQAVVIE